MTVLLSIFVNTDNALPAQRTKHAVKSPSVFVMGEDGQVEAVVIEHGGIMGFFTNETESEQPKNEGMPSRAMARFIR